MKKYIFLAILIILGAGGYTTYLSFDNIVKKAVNKYASQVTGTEVNLGGISFSPLKGALVLNNLTVGNPKNYSKPYAMSLGKIAVSVDIKSLFSDTIIINSVEIQNPAITYEMLSVTKNNISQLLSNINKNTASANKKQAAAEAKPAEAKPTEAKPTVNKSTEPSKKIIIDNLLVSGGEIGLAANIAGQSASANIALPNIEMKNIGRDKKTTIADTISIVMSKLLDTSYEAVINSNTANLENMAKDTLNKAIDRAVDNEDIKKLKSILDI